MEILRRYHPVLIEKSYLLMIRHSSPDPCELKLGRMARKEMVSFDEEIDLNGVPDKYQTITMTVSYSWWEKIRKFLFKPRPIYLIVHTDSGDRLVFRLIPSMAQSEFLINPLLLETRDILNLYGSSSDKRIRSLTITKGKRDKKRNIGIVVKSYPEVTCCKLSDTQLWSVNRQDERVGSKGVITFDPLDCLGEKK